MTRAGWIACGAIAVAGVVVLRSCWPVVSAALTRNGEHTSAAEEGKAAVDRFKNSTEAQVAAIKGRSAFFPPPPKAAPIAERPPSRPVVDTTPKPPPAPTRYGGPGIQAIINGTVWFNDGKRIAVGESTGTGSSAVTVLAAESPWAVKLKWEGHEWEVPLFERDGVIYPSKPVETPKTEAVKSDKPAETPKNDSGKTEPVKTEPGKPESGKADPAKPEAPKESGSDPKAAGSPGNSEAKQPESKHAETKQSETKPNENAAKDIARTDKKDEGSK